MEELEALADAVIRRMGPPRPAGANIGHGHVFKREDGLLARCGGPSLCRDCARDQVRFDQEVAAGVAFIMDTSLGGP